MKAATIATRSRGDLDPASNQPELYANLLHAVAGGLQDVATWLCQQDYCLPADRLAVAQFWGGDQLRRQVESLSD